MAKSLNIVIGANIDKLRDGMNQAVMVIQTSGKKMSADVAESAKSITDRLGSISTKNPTDLSNLILVKNVFIYFKYLFIFNKKNI